VIETSHLTKWFGHTLAVDDLTMRVEPGRVTGFLGPNGAGKSTTIRLIMGLDRPETGYATVNGKPYGQHGDPLRQVGALLDARAAHPGRTARNHLRGIAVTQGIPMRRVDELLELTGLAPVANKPVKGFSTGMAQRLGIAVALLGDPQTLILDEPINGLDPEGVAWVRGLVRDQARAGKTVLLSSHLMSEMQMVADQTIVLARGRLLADKPIGDFIADASGVATRVVSPDATAIRDGLSGPDVTVTALEPGVLRVDGLAAATIGRLASDLGWTLEELTPLHSSLEDAYAKLTETSGDFTSARDARPYGGGQR